jgi:histidine triad (HIT) family protein
MAKCVFCERIRKDEYDEVRHRVVRFEPLNPVTPGHMLFVPIDHDTSAAENPMGAAMAMKFAAEYVNALGAPRYASANIITSIGVAATQTVPHTHIHVVPRRYDDGLHLPWTGQKQ